MEELFLATKDELATKFISNISDGLGVSIWLIALILIVVVIWDLVWRLMALWKSARKGSIVWFIVLGLTNTLGILPILYIYVFSKMNYSKKKTSGKRKTKRKSR